MSKTQWPAVIESRAMLTLSSSSADAERSTRGSNPACPAGLYCSCAADMATLVLGATTLVARLEAALGAAIEPQCIRAAPVER